jgi:hypothetical protein
MVTVIENKIWHGQEGNSNLKTFNGWEHSNFRGSGWAEELLDSGLPKTKALNIKHNWLERENMALTWCEWKTMSNMKILVMKMGVKGWDIMKN